MPFPVGESWPPSNIWFLGPTRVFIPNGISIVAAIFEQLTAECPITLQWGATFSPKLPLPMKDRGHHLMHGTYGPPESASQMASGSARPFLRGIWTCYQTDRQTTIICVAIGHYGYMRCSLKTELVILMLTYTYLRNTATHRQMHILPVT